MVSLHSLHTIFANIFAGINATDYLTGNDNSISGKILKKKNRNKAKDSSSKMPPLQPGESADLVLLQHAAAVEAASASQTPSRDGKPKATRWEDVDTTSDEGEDEFGNEDEGTDEQYSADDEGANEQSSADGEGEDSGGYETPRFPCSEDEDEDSSGEDDREDSAGLETQESSSSQAEDGDSAADEHEESSTIEDEEESSAEEEEEEESTDKNDDDDGNDFASCFSKKNITNWLSGEKVSSRVSEDVELTAGLDGKKGAYWSDVKEGEDSSDDDFLRRQNKAAEPPRRLDKGKGKADKVSIYTNGKYSRANWKFHKRQWLVPDWYESDITCDLSEGYQIQVHKQLGAFDRKNKRKPRRPAGEAVEKKPRRVFDRSAYMKAWWRRRKIRIRPKRDEDFFEELQWYLCFESALSSFRELGKTDIDFWPTIVDKTLPLIEDTFGPEWRPAGHDSQFPFSNTPWLTRAATAAAHPFDKLTPQWVIEDVCNEGIKCTWPLGVIHYATLDLKRCEEEEKRRGKIHLPGPYRDLAKRVVKNRRNIRKAKAALRVWGKEDRIEQAKRIAAQMEPDGRHHQFIGTLENPIAKIWEKHLVVAAAERKEQEERRQQRKQRKQRKQEQEQEDSDSDDSEDSDTDSGVDEEGYRVGTASEIAELAKGYQSDYEDHSNDPIPPAAPYQYEENELDTNDFYQEVSEGDEATNNPYYLAIKGRDLKADFIAKWGREPRIKRYYDEGAEDEGTEDEWAEEEGAEDESA